MLDKEIIQRGNFVAVYEQGPLLQAIHEILQMMSLTIQFKNLEIRLETQIRDDLVIAFDKRRLQQVLLNLLSNAIKY